MKGVGGSNLKKRIEMLLDGVNLTEVAKRPIGTYSGGMKQRIGIAQALLNDPKVLMLDEPTVGLDPEERMRFRGLISDLAQDSIVILSSHIVSDIETIADNVAIMKSGSLVTTGTQEEVIEQVRGKVFETEIESSSLDAFKKSQQVVDTIRQKQITKVRYISESPTDKSTPQEASLEDAYLFLTNSKAI
jgi:ABC-type multidrug transport system ATPase subunit